MAFCTFARRGLTCVAALLVSLVSARATDFQVLYTFCTGYHCLGGSDPSSGLIMDAQRTLYGTLESGAIFSLAADGTYAVLYNFCSQQNCTDGELPQGNLVRDSSGNLYGATDIGGSGADCPPSQAECGTVFKVAPDGTETVLYNFCSQAHCADGAFPNGNLILDAQGNLYGTTLMGGTKGCQLGIGCGTVFRLAPDGTEEVLHKFCSRTNCTDGNAPYPGAGLIRDSEGDLFGTTIVGGSNDAGVVFKLKPDGKEIVLYNFCSRARCADGAYPAAGLLDGGNGTFWGTTQQGGAHKRGTVFQLTADGNETVLYSFCAVTKHCLDGSNPMAALIRDSQGNLYGTTAYGGGGNDTGNCKGCGVAFKVAPDGTESVLHKFCHSLCDDGAIPVGALVANGKGELFGATTSGGSADIGGTIYKLKE